MQDLDLACGFVVSIAVVASNMIMIVCVLVALLQV